MTTVYVTHPSYVAHDIPGHPEHAGRIRAVWKAIEEAGLNNRLKQLKAPLVTDEQILAVHTPQYLEIFDRVGRSDQGMRFDADTIAFPESIEAARLSAGGVIAAVDAVMNGSALNGLAAVRPPGHHAVPHRAMGFCFLGNIAIAARHAQRMHHIKRIMIVDYDVHHGNGTQDMFYDDDSVLFISTHQYPYYPGTGSIQEIGEGRGRGYTINIPLEAGHGDQSYAELYEQIVFPAARRFKPELILVSAGFDAHWIDPLAMMKLSLDGYTHLNRQLIRMAEELCEGKIIFVMEGGYDLGALGYGVRNIAHALLGDEEISDPLGIRQRREPEVTALIAHLKKIHQL